MQRTKKKRIPKADLILTGDWHLRDSAPKFRDYDEFWESQWSNVHQIRTLQERYDCPILHTGDLFHVSNPSSHLLAKTIIELPEKFYTVYGQHDLPYHNFDLRHKSGIYVLDKAGVLQVLSDYRGSWGHSEPSEFPIWTGFNIGVWHKFVWDGETIPWPNCKEQTAKQILKEHKKFDLIITGDHHRPFIYKYKGRQLVNCGCLTRQASDYADFKPRVYLYEAHTKIAHPFYLDVNKDIMTAEYESKKEKNKQLEAFIESLSGQIGDYVSFEKNLRISMDKNKVKKKLRTIIQNSLDYDG